MPLRLDNARALPTCPQQKQQTKKTFKSRFKVDHAASPMPETRQPERLAPRATSNRNGGRDHLGILGEIKSVHPGDIIGISSKWYTILQGVESNLWKWKVQLEEGKARSREAPTRAPQMHSAAPNKSLSGTRHFE
jgi:hypothetical protein